MHQFSGSTIEEALQQATAELGRDITVVRARRVTSKRTLGFGSKVRFEVDVLAGTQTPPVEASASGGEFDGVLAGLIDSIERLEADQLRPAARPAAETARPAAEPAEQTRVGFGEADLAGSGYGRKPRPNDGGGRTAPPAAPSPIDLRPVRAEVADDVLAALADRPAGRSTGRSAGRPDDATPRAARLTRAATLPDTEADALPGSTRTPAARPARPVAGAGAGAGAGNAGRPVRAVPPSSTPPGADALARAARLAAERAAAERAGSGRGAAMATDEQLDEPRPDAAAERVRRAAERQDRERRLLDERRQAEDEADRIRRDLERAEAERAEAVRLESARLEAARLEAARLEAERLESARLEAARLEAARLEAERAEAERREHERAAFERAEVERLLAERQEAERQLAEQLEAERALAAHREAELREAARLEVERALAERDEAARLEAARLEAERLEADRREAAELRAMRLAAEQARRQEIERQAELRRQAAEQARLERMRAERAEAEAAEMRRRLEMERDVAEAWLAAQDRRRSAWSAGPAGSAAPSGWSPRADALAEDDIVDAEWTAVEEPVLDLDAEPAAEIDLDDRDPVIDLVEHRDPVIDDDLEIVPDAEADAGADGHSDRPGDPDDASSDGDATVGGVVEARTTVGLDGPGAGPGAGAGAGPASGAEAPAERPSGFEATEVSQSRRDRRRRRDLPRRERSRRDPAGSEPVQPTTSTAVELAGLPYDNKRSAGLMASLSPSRGLARQPMSPMTLTNRVLSFGPEGTGGAELALGGEPQWSLENLADVGLPPVAIETLAGLELRVDADWMSAVEAFIRENVPAPVTQAQDASGVFLSGSDAQSAGAIIRAGLLGFVPGYIFVDGQFRLATSIELMLAVRSCLPR